MVADPIRRAHVLVAGRVQGVWFRKGTQHEARRLKLTGWVRNLDDGRVEFEAEGPSADVDQLIAWAQMGTPEAVVESVTVTDVTPTGEADAFEVRR